MAVSDDEIIKRKLLIEGEGGTDDLRLTRFCKAFNKWCHSNDSPVDSMDACEKLLLTLDHVQSAIDKTKDVYDMNKTEQNMYQKLIKATEQALSGTQKEILECKTRLLQAKRVRKNRQEYDALAKVIQQHPDRGQTTLELQKLDKEIERMKEMKTSLEEEKEIRRKQFHVLISAIHELQDTYDDYEVNNSRSNVDEPLPMDTTK